LKENITLEGHSHVIVALAGAVAVDSFLHLSGPPLVLGGHEPTLSLLAVKGIFYGGVAIGGLAPDIDNTSSTLGKRLGIISKEINHHFGHRTIMHSLIGLAIWAALGYGAQQLAVHFLAGHMGSQQYNFITGSYTLWVALVLGYILHLFGDSLTEEGIPIFWPNKFHLGFPPIRALRFRAGSITEPIVVWLLVILVGAGLWFNIIQV
jgi:inner membrane protein